MEIYMYIWRKIYRVRSEKDSEPKFNVRIRLIELKGRSEELLIIKEFSLRVKNYRILNVWFIRHFEISVK